MIADTKASNTMLAINTKKGGTPFQQERRKAVRMAVGNEKG